MSATMSRSQRRQNDIKSMLKHIKAKKSIAKAKQPIEYELREFPSFLIEKGTNNVYDFDREECVGTYNRKTKKFTMKQ